jgi:hypothetical protein
MNKNLRKNLILEDFKIRFKKTLGEIEILAIKESRLEIIIRITRRSIESIENNYIKTIICFEKIASKENRRPEQLLEMIDSYFEIEIKHLELFLNSEIQNELKKISNLSKLN